MRYRLTNLRELQEKVGMTMQVAASRLFGGRNVEERFIAYEEGKTIYCIKPVSLLPWAEALKCGVVDLKTEED